MTLLSERKVLITGASGGLGEHVVRAFLDVGARVAGVARQWHNAPANDRFTAIEAELTSPDGCRYVVERALDAMGGLDTVVHLMGGFAMEGDVQDTRVETLDHMLNLNLRPAFLIFQESIPRFTGGDGRILAIGSRAGQYPEAGLSAYAVSKAALHALIQTLAAESVKHGYTANAVLPSTIDTAANRKAMPKADFSKWVSPESIAQQLVLLASPAGADVNGALIPVDGRL